MIIDSGITIGSGIAITGEASVITAGLQLYLDAGNASSYSGSGSPIDDIKLARDDTSTRYFNGNIAVAQLYNTALSEAQISQNFEADRRRFGI